MFRTLGRYADGVNLWLASGQLLIGRRRQRRQDRLHAVLREALSPQARPDALRFYIDAARAGWRGLLFYSGIVSIAITFIGDKAAGYEGRWIGIAILASSATVCLVGELDLVWRLVVLRSARRRYAADGEVLGESTLRLLRIARANDGVLVLQLCAGLSVGLAVGLAK